MAKHSSHILEMARKGAEHRYEELKTEIAALIKNFPHLSGSKAGKVSKVARFKPGKELDPKATRRRSKMSAAQRKAVSARMKKYWATRRKAKATKA